MTEPRTKLEDGDILREQPSRKERMPARFTEEPPIKREHSIKRQVSMKREPSVKPDLSTKRKLSVKRKPSTSQKPSISRSKKGSAKKAREKQASEIEALEEKGFKKIVSGKQLLSQHNTTNKRRAKGATSESVSETKLPPGFLKEKLLPKQRLPNEAQRSIAARELLDDDEPWWRERSATPPRYLSAILREMEVTKQQKEAQKKGMINQERHKEHRETHFQPFNLMGLPVETRFLVYNMLMYKERILFVLPRQRHAHALITIMAVSRGIRFEIQTCYFPREERFLVKSRTFDWIYPEATVFYTLPRKRPLNNLCLTRAEFDFVRGDSVLPSSRFSRQKGENIMVRHERHHSFYAVFLFEAMQKLLNETKPPLRFDEDCDQTKPMSIDFYEMAPMRIKSDHACLEHYRQRMAELDGDGYRFLTVGGTRDIPWRVRRTVL